MGKTYLKSDLKTDLVDIANIPFRNQKALSYSVKCEKKYNLSLKRTSIIISLAIGIILGSVFGLFHVLSVSATQTDAQTVISCEMTYYTATGHECANGKMPRFGICSYSKEFIGQTAIIYTEDMELIGYFEIYDTGYGRIEDNGKGTIQNGNCIDIFMESDKAGKEFIQKYGNKVKIIIVDAKG